MFSQSMTADYGPHLLSGGVVLVALTTLLRHGIAHWLLTLKTVRRRHRLCRTSLFLVTLGGAHRSSPEPQSLQRKATFVSNNRRRHSRCLRRLQNARQVQNCASSSFFSVPKPTSTSEDAFEPAQLWLRYTVKGQAEQNTSLRTCKHASTKIDLNPRTTRSSHGWQSHRRETRT